MERTLHAACIILILRARHKALPNSMQAISVQLYSVLNSDAIINSHGQLCGLNQQVFFAPNGTPRKNPRCTSVKLAITSKSELF